MKSRLDKYGWLIIAGFFVMTLARTLNHAMWRDECQPWLMARYAESFRHLFNLTLYETHPFWWYACLRVFSLLGLDYHAMQVFHVLIATATAFVVLRFSPFSKLMNVLLIFGYFFSFEFAIISREYALGSLLLFAACATWKSAIEKPMPFTACLFILAQTSPLFVLVAGSMELAFIARACMEKRYRVLQGNIILVAFGFLIALFQYLPATNAAPQRFDLSTYLYRLIKFEPLASFFGAYIPLPSLTQGFWNTNILDAFPTIQKSLCAALLIATPISIRRNTPALVFFVTCVALLFAFTCYFPSSALRHSGVLFLATVAMFWISGSYPFPRTVTAVLGIHIVAGFLVGVTEVAQPFSGGKNAARFIQTNYPNAPIIADVEAVMTPISTYLDKPVFCASRKRYQTYYINDTSTRPTPLQPEEIAAVILQYPAKSFLLVINYYPVSIPQTAKATLLFQSVGAGCGESFVILGINK